MGDDGLRLYNDIKGSSNPFTATWTSISEAEAPIQIPANR